jgi:membrane-bound serine protease (ClpP class)
MHVIDLVAPTLPALLHSLDGRKTKPKGFTIQTDHATVSEASPGFLTRLLSTLIDPNLISLLFLAGLAGLGYEVFHPGVVLPGALGAVSLVTALYGFSVLPFSWAGLALVLLGLTLLVIDAHVVSHGALTVSGLTSLAVGMLMLFHDAPSPYETSLPLVLSISLVLGGFWAFALTKAVQVRRRPVVVGVHELVGATGEVRRGLVFVRGELWQARPADGEPLADGERVRVEAVDGLVLTVRHVGAPAAVS